MYETLLAKIGTTLDSVSLVKDHFSYPKSKLTAYPSVFYFPAGFENSFETNAENLKTYSFTMLVIIGMERKTNESTMSTLAKTVDAIVAQFDQDWNQGTIEGHRVWVKVDSAEAWSVSEEQDGQEVVAPLNVEIKLLTTN